MTKNKLSFYRVFLLIFITLSMLLFICYKINPTLIHVPGIYYSQLYFLVIIPLGHWIAAKGLKDKARDFHIYYMGSMGIRFLIALFYLFLMVLFFPEGAWPIVINFFLLYILYSSFEISSLIGNLRAEK